MPARLFAVSLAWLLTTCTAASAFGQEPPRRHGPAAALGIEALGGVAGAAAGFGTVVLLTDSSACGDDLTCILGHAGLALTGATVASAVGAYAAGTAFGTRPSGVGAAVGAIAGVAAAVGMDHLLREEADLRMGDAATIMVVALTQGMITALGSRIGAGLRRR